MADTSTYTYRRITTSLKATDNRKDVKQTKSPIEIQQMYFKACFYYKIGQYQWSLSTYLTLLRNHTKTISNSQHIEICHCLGMIYFTFADEDPSKLNIAAHYFLQAAQKGNKLSFNYAMFLISKWSTLEEGYTEKKWKEIESKLTPSKRRAEEDKINKDVLQSCISVNNTSLSITRIVKKFENIDHLYHQDHLFFLLIESREFSNLRPFCLYYMLNIFYKIEEVAQFQNSLKTIRQHAKNKLEKELKNFETTAAQINFLKEAKKMKIFSSHRNPFIFFKDTDTVSEIDCLITQTTIAHRQRRYSGP